MNTVTLVIPGTPTPKGRSRSTRSGRHYTPAATRAAETSVLAVWLVTTQHARPAHEGPVTLDLIATFVPPASWPKWKRERALAGEWPHTSRPDVDNLVKLVKDGLNGAAWLDDSQVTNVSGAKQYGTTPHTTVMLTFHDVPKKENERNKQ